MISLTFAQSIARGVKNLKEILDFRLSTLLFFQQYQSEGVEKLKKSDKFKNLVVAYFNFCSIHSEGINFSLGQLNILRTFYIPSVVAKNGKLRERTFVPGLDGTAQPVSKAKIGRSNNDTYVQSQVEWEPIHRN